jgi:hypothetical protein
MNPPEHSGAGRVVAADQANHDPDGQAHASAGTLQQRITQQLRRHRPASNRIGRTPGTDRCVCGAPVWDWDEHRAAVAATVVPPGLDGYETVVRAWLARQLTDLAGGMRDVGAELHVDGDPAEAALYDDGAKHLDDIAEMIRGEGLNAIPPMTPSKDTSTP